MPAGKRSTSSEAGIVLVHTGNISSSKGINWIETAQKRLELENRGVDEKYYHKNNKWTKL